MAPEQDIDQDALAAEWGVALEKETPARGRAAAGRRPRPATEEAAAQWAAMVDEGSRFQTSQRRRRAHPQSG